MFRLVVEEGGLKMTEWLASKLNEECGMRSTRLQMRGEADFVCY
jgi:hypothetical protein